MSEAHLSAQYPQESQTARLSPPHGRPSGSGHHQVEAAQGAQASVGLIWRVQHRATFAEIRRGRHRRRGPLTVTWGGDELSGPPRVAFAIGRKVGPAVRRNRLRRQLRAIVASEGARLASGAYLIGASPRATDLSYDELRTTLMHVLDSLGALGESHPARRGDQRARTPMQIDG
jgi:ribonuclease P protein component